MYDVLVLGGYGFYDYRQSERQNSFQQATVGVELMSWLWEARCNGYVPTGNGLTSGGGNGTAFLQNGAFYIQGTGQSALRGCDAELGTLLAADPSAQHEVRAFAGGYYFNSVTGASNQPGVYGRLEARIYDLEFLGDGSRLELGVISSYDDANKFQVTGMVNVRVAWGTTNCPGGLSLIERRMLDRVVRRHDLVTTGQSSVTELATPTMNGVPATSVTVVHPGDDLTAAVQSTANQGLILVEGGGTYFVPNGVVLAPGQTLAGGGSQISVVGNTTGTIGIFTVPGARPTLERQNTLGPVVTMDQHTSILGFDIIGGDHGISGGTAFGITEDLLIADVTISQTSSDGMYLEDIEGLTIRNVTISQTGGLGALWEDADEANIQNLRISNTVGSALYYNCGEDVHMKGLFVDATGATDDAVRLHTQNDSFFTNFDIRNSSHNALTIASSTVVSFENINLTNVTGDGMQAYQSGTFTLSRFAMTDVGASGLVINDTALVSLNNSVFTNVNNVVSYLNIANYISGTDNVATGYSTLFTGTTNGGGSIQFTQPNATAP